MSRGATITIIVVGCILLAIANICLWATLDIFNADRFGQHVAEGMQSEASTEALAGPIVEFVLEEIPEIPRLLRGPAETAVASLLQLPALTPVFEHTAALATTAMTTSAKDVVGIDVGGFLNDIGNTAVTVVSALDEEAGASLETALEGILAESGAEDILTIYEEGFLPGLRMISILAPWLAFLTGAGAIVLFVVAGRRALDTVSARRYVGIGVMITAVLGYVILVPAIQLIAANGVAAPAMQVVVREVISVLTRPYLLQSLVLLVTGLAVWMLNRGQGESVTDAASS